MTDLEQAMVNLANAVDGNGRMVRLYTGDLTSVGLRRATRDFGNNMLAEGMVFISGLERDGATPCTRAEAAAFDNLALLARATAAAIRHGV